MRPAKLASVIVLSALVATGVAIARPFSPPPQSGGGGTMQMQIYRLADQQWNDGPGSLPPGARFTVLEGDPAKEGLFTMRLRLPDGYRIPPHFHSGVEHVTVIAGTFNVGMGEKFDQAATRPMPAGTFGYWPPPMRHFAWTQGETILQLHGVGPWTVTYVNPADDPRRK